MRNRPDSDSEEVEEFLETRPTRPQSVSPPPSLLGDLEGKDHPHTESSFPGVSPSLSPRSIVAEETSSDAVVRNEVIFEDDGYDSRCVVYRRMLPFDFKDPWLWLGRREGESISVIDSAGEVVQVTFKSITTSGQQEQLLYKMESVRTWPNVLNFTLKGPSSRLISITSVSLIVCSLLDLFQGCSSTRHHLCIFLWLLFLE